MSKNHQFLEAGAPIRAYQKKVGHTVSGRRLHPKTKTPVVFILASKSPEFEYYHEIVELYSEDDLKYFRRANDYLFNEGIILEYTSEEEKAALEDNPNYLTDEEIDDVASIRNTIKMKNKLEPITSRATLQRIWDRAIEKGMPKGTLGVLEEKMKQ